MIAARALALLLLGACAAGTTPPAPPEAGSEARTGAAPAPAPAGLRFEPARGHGLPGLYYGSVAALDYDQDGRTDLLLAGNFDTVFDSTYFKDSEQARLHDRVRLFRNESRPGEIVFRLARELDDIGGIRGTLVASGDFDGDRRPDFAVQIRNGDPVASYLNQGGGRFQKVVLSPRLANNSTSLGMRAADVDGDGQQELVFLSDGGDRANGLWYRYDKARRRWEGRQADFLHAISYGGTLALGDLDGDGFPELAAGGNSNQPFGRHDCTRNLMYGQIHRGRGRANPGFDPAVWLVPGNLGLKQPADRRADLRSCHGMDNAGMEIADLDGDGHNDLIIAGSATGFDGPPGKNGQHYDFAVLFNDGGGRFQVFEQEGEQDPDGSTNGGAGNVDFPNIAVGELNGDGLAEVFVQGHRRDFRADFDVNGDGNRKDNPYVFADLLFQSDGKRGFRPVPLEAYLPRFAPADLAEAPELGFLAGRPRFVGEGGQLIADLDGDGRNDLLFTGAELPFHTNGANARDRNTKKSLVTYVLRNVTPVAPK